VGGLDVDIVALEKAFYVRGSAAFYDRIAGPQAGTLLQGKWLKAPVNGGNFSALARLTNLADLLDTALDEHDSLRRGADTRVNGEQAVAVQDTTRGGTLYVAAVGRPYPLAISRAGGRSGRIAFSRWNQPVTLTAPSGAININELQAGG
jgi:hypothetical protein